MATIAYNLSIPAAGNNPSSDQPKMQVNTNAINTILGQDHFNFNVSNGGWHQQSTYVDSILALGTPITIAAGQAAIYAKTNGQSQIMATSDTGTNEYQLTRFIDASFALFGTDTMYPGAAAFELGGWTFLPGQNVATTNALILQYGSSIPGSIISGHSIGTTSFPISFSKVPFFIALSPISQVGGASINNTISVVTGTLDKTSFGWNWQTSTSQYTGFYWWAIGV